MSEEIDNKKCRKCQSVKLLIEFGIDRKCKDGHKTRCRECIAIENRNYQISNRQVINAAKQRYRKRNHEKISQYSRQYRARVNSSALMLLRRELNELVAQEIGSVTPPQLLLCPETIKFEKLLSIYKFAPDSDEGKLAYREIKSIAISIKMDYEIFATLIKNIIND